MISIFSEPFCVYSTSLTFYCNASAVVILWLKSYLLTSDSVPELLLPTSDRCELHRWTADVCTFCTHTRFCYRYQHASHLSVKHSPNNGFQTARSLATPLFYDDNASHSAVIRDGIIQPWTSSEPISEPIRFIWHANNITKRYTLPIHALVLLCAWDIDTHHT